MFVIWRGIETIKFLEGIGAPFMLGVGLLLLWWITGKAGGFGPVLSAPSKFHNAGEFLHFFVPSLTGMVGFWATVALNIPDFTRYAKIQRAQMLGQALGLPAAMTLYSFIGVAVTSRRWCCSAKPSGTRWCCSGASISRWSPSSRWSRC